MEIVRYAARHVILLLLTAGYNTIPTQPVDDALSVLLLGYVANRISCFYTLNMRVVLISCLLYHACEATIHRFISAITS